jgi:hypothetical protein
MTADRPQLPFQLFATFDQDELLGGRWWQEGVRKVSVQYRHRDLWAADEQLLARRRALLGLLCLGGVGFIGVLASEANEYPSDVAIFGERASLDYQRAEGLAVGAADAAFAWPDAVATAVDGSQVDTDSLSRLAADLTPSRVEDAKDCVPTLFQCVRDARDGSAFARQFRLIRSAAMAAAFAEGEALRELLELAEDRQQLGLVIDLPGPESVSLAAGLAPDAVPIFVFGNWPHPRGVVPAHLTLAAAAYWRPRFLAQAPGASPAVAWVLDRNRLAPYRNEPNVFDNRYVVSLPSAERLQQRGIRRLLYVVPADAAPDELEDLRATFADWKAAGLSVRMLGLRDFAPAEAPQPARATSGFGGTRYFWGGSPAHHYGFWNHYGWPSRGRPGPAAPTPVRSFGADWTPGLRPPGSGLGSIGRTTTPTFPTSGGSWGRSGGGISS